MLKTMINFDKRRNIRDSIAISLISVILTLITIIWIVPSVSSFITKLKTSEIIASIAVVVSAIGITWQVIVFRLKHIARLKINLSTNVVNNNYVVITSEIENTGGKTVIPKNVYLFIDEGILTEGGYYDFPFLLKHEDNEYDCVLSKICQQEKLSYPKDRLERRFLNIHTDCIQLRHISSESILHIVSGENFKEDVVIKPPHPGVYRAILIFTAKDADCICASKHFIIVKEGENA